MCSSSSGAVKKQTLDSIISCLNCYPALCAGGLTGKMTCLMIFDITITCTVSMNTYFFTHAHKHKSCVQSSFGIGVN